VIQILFLVAVVIVILLPLVIWYILVKMFDAQNRAQNRFNKSQIDLNKLQYDFNKRINDRLAEIERSVWPVR
jgi:hypothetical protein